MPRHRTPSCKPIPGTSTHIELAAHALLQYLDKKTGLEPKQWKDF
ncbi:hypothetical protein [Mycobacterium sp.]|nr:hypothetical protein [Mycobacterium sp.]HZA11567.1 hypothetical protein [Mycobacterium sp.]